MERVVLKGMFAEAKKKHREADLEASALVVTIRNLLNPYEEDIASFDTEKILVMAKRLHELVLNMRDLKQKIKKIEEDLNG